MEEQINISPIYNDDCQMIVNLILPIQQIEFGVAITLEAQPDLLDIEAFYHKDGGGFWGAKIRGSGAAGAKVSDGLAGASVSDGLAAGANELVGTIALIAMGHNAGAIRKMFVKKEFRGKHLGIAQRLLETLVGESREKGITDIYLGTVNVMKAAHRFYERNGFSRIAAEELPAYFPRMAADNVFYHLSITNTSAK